ncbi:protein of unknown function [Burkholderia multivorans]
MFDNRKSDADGIVSVVRLVWWRLVTGAGPFGARHPGSRQCRGRRVGRLETDRASFLRCEMTCENPSIYPLSSISTAR